ncbi:hypothetical protein D5S18_26335 [Nocardia panacis]|uniref:Enoyl reductase (ER) domain-containing protein n=1 Tax=Nocardia panacis TaxID=2340916 RepID=A0A3A4K2Q1_9NOCA|nr:zinc-dependent alcohol dehydrogenase family protein [Nocardia panacis]RJO70724.1 hypothetical protein D5S18_26335 [Nocardia panacis]
MRAIRFHRYGDPDDVLVAEDIPMPVPTGGQALVRVHTRPVNPSDVMYIEGRYGRAAEFPATAGFEGAGVVVRPPPNGLPATGTRVSVAARGTWQSYVAAATDEVIVAPDGVDDILAAQLTVNPYAARMLLDHLDLPPGGWVALSAGASAVAVQFGLLAAAREVRCIHLVRSKFQAERLAGGGADIVIDLSQAPDAGAGGPDGWAARIKEITSGGVDAAIDSVGGAVGRLLLDSLRTGGTLVAFGILSGEPIPVPTGELIFRNLHLEGFWLPEHLEKLSDVERKNLDAAVFEDLLRNPEALAVADTFDLADAADAVRRSRSTDRTGKVLLVG